MNGTVLDIGEKLALPPYFTVTKCDPSSRVELIGGEDTDPSGLTSYI